MAEREVRWQGVARKRLDYVVQPLTDVQAIRSILASRVEYTAYALGQLEPALFPRTRWYYARGTTGTGLVLHSRGGLGDATFVMGDADAVLAILMIHPGTAQTYATCQPQHIEYCGGVPAATQQPMIRMGGTAQFRGAPEKWRRGRSPGRYPEAEQPYGMRAVQAITCRTTSTKGVPRLVRAGDGGDGRDPVVSRHEGWRGWERFTHPRTGARVRDSGDECGDEALLE